jgi:hypothetical protein
MKIEKVDVIPYGVPIRAFADAYTGFSVSNAVLVKIFDVSKIWTLHDIF